MLFFVHADGELAAIALNETTTRRIGSKLIQKHAHKVLMVDSNGLALAYWH